MELYFALSVSDTKIHCKKLGCEIIYSKKQQKKTNDWQVKAIAMIGRIWNIADTSHIFALYTHSNVMKEGSAVKAIWKIKK